MFLSEESRVAAIRDGSSSALESAWRIGSVIAAAIDMSAARRFISWFWLISPRASFIPAKLFFACVNPEENASLNISVIELVKFTASRPQTP
jgi:hypothetical protein